MAENSHATGIRVLELGVNWFQSGSGGLDRVYFDLMGGLSAANVDATGLVIGPIGDTASNPQRVMSFGRPGASAPELLWRARTKIDGLMRTGHFDLVASHFAMFTFPALDRLRGVPLVVHFHGPWADEGAEEKGGQSLSSTVKRAMERSVYRRAKRVIVLSQAFGDLVRYRYGVPEELIRQVPGSVDLGRFGLSISREDARARLGWPQDRRIILSVRRLARRMGLDRLITAMAEIVKSEPGVLLMIGGRGHMAAALSDQVSALGLEDHVRFLGFLPDEQLPLAYRAAEINVVPTVALEGFGLTTVEALASGTPSMVTPVGGLPEVVGDLSPNLIFRSSNAADIATGLIAALDGSLSLPNEITCSHYARTRYDAKRAAVAVADGLSRDHELAMRRTLFINQTGTMGGAEMGLIDIAAHFGPQRCAVVLFGDGPLRGRLNESGLDVTILKADSALMGVTRNAGKWRILLSVPSLLSLVWRLIKIARHYDILYANSQKAAAVTMLVGFLTRKKVIWHVHDMLSSEHFAGFQRFGIVKLANFTARRVIAISEVTKQAFVECGGDPHRVTVVSNGIDLKPFIGIDNMDVTAMRESMGLAGLTLVGLFGRITPWKGQHVLIRALKELPTLHAVIVGDAMFGEDDYKQELKELAAQLDVADRVHWIGFSNKVPELMRMVDIIVHTSTSPEPFGRVIIEGVLSGRPVLATDHGASRELLGNNSSWLVVPNDPEALAQAIQRTLNYSDAEREAMVAEERERATRLFSLPLMLRGIEQVLDQP